MKTKLFCYVPDSDRFHKAIILTLGDNEIVRSRCGSIDSRNQDSVHVLEEEEFVTENLASDTPMYACQRCFGKWSIVNK